MKQILLIRHGKTSANLRHLYHGSTDLPLCPEGIRELGEKRNLPEGDWRFLTSGMKRAEETLVLLFGPVAHETDPRFRELDFGVFEMKSYEELKDDPSYQAWISGDNEKNIAPGGESGEIMTSRVLEAFRDLQNREGDWVLVTHGGPIAAIMTALFPEEGKNRYQWQSPCGGGYLLIREASSWRYKIM